MRVTLGGQTVAARVRTTDTHLTITTAGGVPVDSKEIYVNATYTLTRRSGQVEAGTLRIRGRGNYTWTLAKKPYRLNFDVATAPIGMSATQRNWALLANHDDPRKVATILGLTLGAQLSGLTWTPEFRILEVTLNGDYLGLYLLTDLVRVEGGRVTGEPASTASPTGTWLAEISRRYIGEGVPGFTTSHDVMIQFDTPEVDLASAVPEEAALADYFRDWVQNFETVLFSGGWLDSGTGYAQHIDMQSFVDWWLVNELGSNQDSNFESSCKLWKEPDSEGGLLHMGPLWDFGISFGNVVNAAHPTTGWWTRAGASWIDRMLDDPAFAAMAVTRWAHIQSLLPGLLRTVDATLREQEEAIRRDEDRWNTTPIDVSVSIAYVSDWITARAAWITANL